MTFPEQSMLPEEDHLRIVISEDNLKRKISRSWIHPLVQLPPEFLWNILILYGFLIIVLKLSYQVPLACPCYKTHRTGADSKGDFNDYNHLW